MRNRRAENRRPIALAVAVCAVLIASWAVPKLGLGQGGPLAKRQADLLTAPPFDRITLTDGTTLDIEPVSPRPLPPYDPARDEKTETKTKAKARAKRLTPPPEGNVFLPGKEPKKDDGPKQINDINIHVIGSEAGDYNVRRANIRSLEYFEDRLLAEGERLSKAGDYAKAFEYFLRVKSRNPAWKGLSERVDDLLFREGTAALTRDKDHERALRLLNELRTRRPDYPGLIDSLALAYAGRLSGAFDQGAYLQGRRVLRELEQTAPESPLGREWRERFAAKARALVAAADGKTGGEQLDDLAEALRVWPELDGLSARYAEAFRVLPTLDVAVIDLPRPVGPWVRSPADARTTPLVYLPILAGVDEDATRGRLPGQLALSLETTDLGRRLILDVRTDRTWSDGSRPVGGRDVLGALVDRASPGSLSYQARWEELVERIEATDEHRVEVRLTRPLLKPEAWLLGPVGPAQAGPDGLVTESDGSRSRIGDGPFVPESTSDDLAVYQAREVDSNGPGAKIRRIREHRLPDANHALGALVRDEVSLIERIPPDRAASMATMKGIKVGVYEHPSIHLIALDGRNPVLRNRTLRRGLSYAIDRKGLLEETLLRRAIDGNNAQADGPFAKGSYADAPGVKPLEHDPGLARALVRAAQIEMGGGALKLTFEYPRTPEALAVAPKLAEAFRALGIELRTVERPETDLEQELRAGRRFDLAYRSGRWTEPAWDAGPTICPGYDAPTSAGALGSIASARTLQLLLQLERAAQWPEARALVVQLDRESRDELPVIPLWQLDDHYAWRDRLNGPAETAEHLYQKIETWTIEPTTVK